MTSEDLVAIGKNKKKRNSPPSPERGEQLQPGDGGKFIKNNLALASLPQIDLHNPEDVANRLDLYFNLCAENDIKPSVAAMALSLGIARKEISEKVHTEYYGKEVTELLKKGYMILNAMMEDYMQNGKINPVAGIFLMKNNMQYSDQQEVVIAPKNPFGDIQDSKALEERYFASLPETAESDFNK